MTGAVTLATCTELELLQFALDQQTDAAHEVERCQSRVQHVLLDATAEPATTLRLVVSRLDVVRARLEVSKARLVELHDRAAALAAKGVNP